jgi:hypothetical protein
MAPRTPPLLPFAAFLICFAGCAPRAVRVPSSLPGTPANNDYIDLRAGWRLTVVTPILRSGGYTLAAERDLLGYETAHYAVEGRRGGRVRVEFSSAQVMRDGKAEPQPRPIAPLFQDARRPCYVRLIYLVRVSRADHNMAVIAAKRLDALAALTRQVEANPGGACKASRYASCSWIPDGIAVRPEALKIIRGIPGWVDAPRQPAASGAPDPASGAPDQRSVLSPSEPPMTVR